MKRAITHRLSLLVILLAMATCGGARAQQPPDPDVVRQPIFASFSAFVDALEAASTSESGEQMSALWQRLAGAHQIPFAMGDSVAFLYRGEARHVEWRGDFNGWSDRDALVGRRMGASDVWMATAVFPPDARLDYKIVLNGDEWILDPDNPLQVWSGYGPNSELRMPSYVYPVDAVRREGIARGTFAQNALIESRELGYTVSYRVYTPAGYDTLAALPVLYVTDGHEYAADPVGGLVTVLDNLIAGGAIRPVMAVFIDPREPGHPENNRRASEYVANPRFAAFVADELVPRIDAAYHTDATRDGRAILGTSLGGINSAFFGLTHGDVFRDVAIESPAFQVWEDVYDRFRTTPDTTLKIFLSQGTIGDGDGGRRLRPILDARGFDYQYVETNEGHSWGNWRAQLDDVLRFFWGAAPRR